MMNKPIIYDCDGVLLDIIGGLRKALWEIDGIKTNGLVPLSYDLKDWMGVDDQAFVIDRIQRFNSGEGEYFSNLEPLPGAVEFVKSMRARGYEDSVLTAAGRDAKIMAGRDANLHRVFGGFENIQYVGLVESKKPFLEKMPHSWFIEDNIANAHLGAATGHDTLLIEYEHNTTKTDAESFRRVKDWIEIRSIFDAEHAPAHTL
jgi:FMN phosphatase YigB (HAD superfamily)